MKVEANGKKLNPFQFHMPSAEHVGNGRKVGQSPVADFMEQVGDGVQIRLNHGNDVGFHGLKDSDVLDHRPDKADDPSRTSTPAA